MSQSGDFTACRGVAAQMGGRGSRLLASCLTLSATPRRGSSQETKARNLYKGSSVKGRALCVCPLHSRYGPPVLSGMDGNRTEHIPGLMSSYPRILCSFSTELQSHPSLLPGSSSCQATSTSGKGLALSKSCLHLEPARAQNLCRQLGNWVSVVL